MDWLIKYLGAKRMVVINPGGPKSEVGSTPFSGSEAMAMKTSQLLEFAKEMGFGKRKEEALKVLVCHICMRDV
jgi:hypothetical protein